MNYKKIIKRMEYWDKLEIKQIEEFYKIYWNLHHISKGKY
jgi:hypothetical protein